MENNYSNYDMLDKLIANNKKAKSWTAFWMIILCLMAAAVLWLAHSVSEKNKTINQQVQIIQSSEFSLEVKSRIIDSLTENCNDAKAEIVKSCDSVINQTQTTLSSIVNTSSATGTPVVITTDQQQRLLVASRSIQSIKTKLYNVQLDIKKNNTKLFVQFNNADDNASVGSFLEILKEKSDYVVAPPEYIDNNFPTVIKFYNYRNADEEKKLRNLIIRQFNIDAGSIQINYEKNRNVKTIVEIWLGTRPAGTKSIQLKKPA
jgi:cell division protein FtsL